MYVGEQYSIVDIQAIEIIEHPRPVCTENLSSGVVMVKSAKDGV